ncbi:MAG: mechanosensitive ion channel [Parachlamydiaceae bacterium]|nr:mechanosensitive ion channel [Parachlamydiaceae bacterium]
MNFSLKHFLLIPCFIALLSSSEILQGQATQSNAAIRSEILNEPKAPVKVDVKPQALDEEISTRLKAILIATGWFINSNVEVKNGVVFLTGETKRDDYKKWAEELARNTQDTVAVVNQIQVMPPSIWDFNPVLVGVRSLWTTLLRTIPAILFGIMILMITWLLAKGASLMTRYFLRNQTYNTLIMRVISWAVGLLIFLIGLYSFFHIMGLTTIALTVVGGTGLLGIILGIAFREITENLLASIFLSMNNPFHSGDLIEIEGIMGYVEKLTVRTTILISLDGNYVQIPNATVYRSIIKNFTSNPNRREHFTIGIGYDCAISEAQKIALTVLTEHPAVLKKPEPWVLVDSLGQSTVNLKIFFWIDGSTHSWQKVRSSVIRLVKRAFQTENIPMPDEARELIFPKGISVKLDTNITQPETLKDPVETSEIATDAEGELNSEAEKLKDQASQSRSPEAGRNLLKDDS